MKIEFKLTKYKKKKKKENILCFLHNCIWKSCCKLSLIRREYLLLEVNGLTNSPRILNITQRNFLNVNCFHRDQWIWWRCCRLDFHSVSVGLPCYLRNGLQKRDFLDIYLAMCLGVRKFKNTRSITVIFFFFFENLQNWI